MTMAMTMGLRYEAARRSPPLAPTVTRPGSAFTEAAVEAGLGLMRLFAAAVDEDGL